MSSMGTQLYHFTSEQKEETASLVEECPIAISINDLNYAVILITPVDVEAFVMGFCFSEGIITSPNEVLDIVLSKAHSSQGPIPSHIIADIQLTGRAQQRASLVMRQRKGTSGCGLCGIEAIEQSFPLLPSLSRSSQLNDDLWLNAKTQFDQYQQIGQVSGAIHGALLMEPNGAPLLFAEDIGRHNALDKLIGKALINKYPLRRCHVLMSSRCSTELIQKGVKAEIASLGHLASPSTLAVTQAQVYGLHLVHLPRHAAPRHYN